MVAQVKPSDFSHDAWNSILEFLTLKEICSTLIPVCKASVNLFGETSFWAKILNNLSLAHQQNGIPITIPQLHPSAERCESIGDFPPLMRKLNVDEIQSEIKDNVKPSERLLRSEALGIKRNSPFERFIWFFLLHHLNSPRKVTGANHVERIYWSYTETPNVENGIPKGKVRLSPFSKVKELNYASWFEAATTLNISMSGRWGLYFRTYIRGMKFTFRTSLEMVSHEGSVRQSRATPEELSQDRALAAEREIAIASGPRPGCHFYILHSTSQRGDFPERWADVFFGVVDVFPDGRVFPKPLKTKRTGGISIDERLVDETEWVGEEYWSTNPAPPPLGIPLEKDVRVEMAFISMNGAYMGFTCDLAYSWPVVVEGA